MNLSLLDLFYSKKLGTPFGVPSFFFSLVAEFMKFEPYDLSICEQTQMPSGSMLAVRRQQHTASFGVFGRQIADNPLLSYELFLFKFHTFQLFALKYAKLKGLAGALPRRLPQYAWKTAIFLCFLLPQ